MNEYRTVKSVIIHTKKNGYCSFFSQYGSVYVKEELDRIVMSDRKDFLQLNYCNHADLNKYCIVENNDLVKRRKFVEEEEET